MEEERGHGGRVTPSAAKADEFLELIKTRRSTTQFRHSFIDWDKVSKIIDVGRHAPSSGNLQNWKFILIFDEGLKNTLSEASLQQYWMLGASFFVVLCGEPEKTVRYYGERGKIYTTQNCAAAAQNMLLAAHGLGLAGCWVGAFDEHAVRSALAIPPEITVEAIIAFGIPKETMQKPPKYPLETVLYFNKWRSKIRDPAKYMRDYAVILRRNIGKGKEKLHELAERVLGKKEEGQEK